MIVSKVVQGRICSPISAKCPSSSTPAPSATHTRGRRRRRHFVIIVLALSLTLRGGDGAQGYAIPPSFYFIRRQRIKKRLLARKPTRSCPGVTISASSRQQHGRRRNCYSPPPTTTTLYEEEETTTIGDHNRRQHRRTAHDSSSGGGGTHRLGGGGGRRHKPSSHYSLQQQPPPLPPTIHEMSGSYENFPNGGLISDSNDTSNSSAEAMMLTSMIHQQPQPPLTRGGSNE